MKTRDVNSKLSLKQKIISRGYGKPTRKEGRDGDLTIRIIKGQGLFLFYKWNSKWYGTRMNRDANRYVEGEDPVKIPIRKPSSVGELGFNKGNVELLKSVDSLNQVISMKNSTKTLDVSEVILSRNKDSGSATTEDFKIVNTGSGRAYLHIQTNDANADPYILLSYLQAGETNALKQWCIGMDNSHADDVLRFVHQSSGTAPLTPSESITSRIKMQLDTDGNLDIGGALDISTVLEVGSDTDKFLMLDSETVKYVTGANLLSYIGASNISFDGSTANGILTYKDADEMTVESDFTYSSSKLNVPLVSAGDALGTPSSFVKQIIGYANNSAAPAALDFYKARGSAASPAAVQAGDFSGTQRYLGYDGSNFTLSAAIRGDIEGIASGEVPGMLNFLTAPTGTLASRMVISSVGNVGIGSWTTSIKPHNMLSVEGTLGLQLIQMQRHLGKYGLKIQTLMNYGLQMVMELTYK